MRNGLWMKGLVLGIILLCVDVSIVPSFSGKVQESKNLFTLDQIDQQQTYLTCYYGSYDMLFAQSFIPQLNSLTRIKLVTYRDIQGGSPYNLNVSIRSNLNGTDLTSLTVLSQNIPVEETWFEFNFTDIQTTPGYTYYIIWDTLDGSDGDDYIGWGMGEDSNPYPSGTAWVKLQSGWDTFTFDNCDFCFITYGNPGGNQAPSADFTWIPPSPYPGLTISFDASASQDSDGTITMYEWDWNNDGVYDESHTTPTVTHSWSNVGNYPVTVKVTDDDGAIDTETKTVTVIENQPPSAPTIDGPASGKIKVQHNYTLNALDPNGHDVYYYVDWGDTTNSGWVGPFASGVDIIINHTWTKKGTYIVTAKAKDTYGLEGPTATLEVSMPTSYNIPLYWFMARLLEKFPNAFPILRHLLKY